MTHSAQPQVCMLSNTCTGPCLGQFAGKACLTTAKLPAAMTASGVRIEGGVQHRGGLLGGERGDRFGPGCDLLMPLEACNGLLGVLHVATLAAEAAQGGLTGPNPLQMVFGGRCEFGVGMGC